MSTVSDPTFVSDPKLLARRFVDFARFVLDERERSGTVRGIDHERNRFATHLVNAPFALKALEDVTRSDIEHWISEMLKKPAKDGRGDRVLQAATIRRTSSLCKVIFNFAGPEGLRVIENNPYLGLNIEKLLPGSGGADDRWTYLTHQEQRAIEVCTEIDFADRCAILFAIGTGLTQGEQFQMTVADVHTDDDRPYVDVRLGSSGREASRKRKVQLLGPSLTATRQWLKAISKFAPENPDNLLFPSARGTRRGIGKPLGNGAMLKLALEKAGIRRPVRWADLRHTCAASMALGFWGTRYYLNDVETMLGLSQNGGNRYASLVGSMLRGEHEPVANGFDPGEAATALPGRADDAALTAHLITASVLRAERAEFTTSNDLDRVEPDDDDAVGRCAEPTSWRAERVSLDEQRIAPFAMRLALPPETLARAAAALSTGKHLLLVGPPGTGKTELALAVIDAARAAGYCAGAHVATASADWTTFDTIGGYAVQRNGRLRFRPGALLKAIEGFKWLVIDELNRADVDRAFGELMTVLSGKTTDTTYQLDGGQTVRIGPDADASHLMPPAFRVLATMNTWDKTSLFRLSYAVQRRFAIVHVNVPEDAAYEALLRHHAAQAGHDAALDDDVIGRIVDLFSKRGLLAVRDVGPAVALDLVRYVRRRTSGLAASNAGNALAEAIPMFVLPQLDGLVQADAELAYRTVATLLGRFASRAAIIEMRNRFEELLPHVRLPTDHV